MCSRRQVAAAPGPLPPFLPDLAERGAGRAAAAPSPLVRHGGGGGLALSFPPDLAEGWREGGGRRLLALADMAQVADGGRTAAEWRKVAWSRRLSRRAAPSSGLGVSWEGGGERMQRLRRRGGGRTAAAAAYSPPRSGRDPSLPLPPGSSSSPLHPLPSKTLTERGGRRWVGLGRRIFIRLKIFSQAGGFSRLQ